MAVAAVADYRVEKPYEQKIKKTDATELTLSLVPNTDILAWVASQTPAPFTVGFAAESEHLEKFADEKRRRKKVSLMIANLAQQAIGKDDNEVTILDDKGVRHLPRANKTDLANTLILEIAKAYRAEKK